MTWASASASILLSTMLTFTGAFKLASPAPLGLSLVGLGLRPAMAIPTARIVGIAELTGAIVITAVGGSAGAGVAAGLGILFALVGLWAIATGREVECNCVGPRSRNTLGFRQLALLPLWLAVAALLKASPIDYPVELQLTGLCVSLLIAFVLTAALAAPAHMQTRSIRLRFVPRS